MNDSRQVAAEALRTDVLIIGAGLGASAAAATLVANGLAVTLLPGSGRSRSVTVDGGIVTTSALEAAFHDVPELGQLVNRRERWLRLNAGHPHSDGRAIPAHFAYRREELETWALNRVIRAGAVLIEDFVEGQLLPSGGGRMVLTSERDARTITADVVILAEGHDPRIGMRQGIRPDYKPEEQVHIARTVIHDGEQLRAFHVGDWRPKWGMPVRLQVVPQPDGALFSAACRIENVMRSGRSAREALGSALEANLQIPGIAGDPGPVGVELTYLRRDIGDLRCSRDNVLVSICGSGLIDARSYRRSDLTIATGRELGEFIVAEWDHVYLWDDAGRAAATVLPRPGATYRDDRNTGYIEEGENALGGFVRRSIGRIGTRNR